MKTTFTSDALTGMFLPARMKKGTPLQRQLSTSSSTAAKVSVVESGATSLTSRKPSYWPRTYFFGSAVRTALKNSSFLSRIESWWLPVGGPMPTRASTCRAWFWITSRIAPTAS